MAVGRRRATLNLRAIEVTEIVSKVAGNKKAKQADRHVNMNQVSILTAPIQKKQMRQLSASQYTISKHAPSFCGQCFSFTPSTVVAPQACIQGCDDLPQSIRPLQNVVQCRLLAVIRDAATQPSNPNHVGDGRGSQPSTHGQSRLPSPAGTPTRWQCRRGRPGLRLEG